MLLSGCLVVGCWGKIDLFANGGGEAGVEIPGDVGPGPCALTDPNDPPIPCGPSDGGWSCPTPTKVATCPIDTPCMATVKQSSPRSVYRIGRLRLWKPDALLSLASSLFDPKVAARCANGGTEELSWLLAVDRRSNTLTTGSSRPSTDGRTFQFVDEATSSDAATCLGVPAPPVRIAPARAPIAMTGTGFAAAPMPALDIAIYDASGLPTVLPLREVSIRVPSTPDPSCIGSWNPKFWCDGDFLGWTTGGAIVAKITAEEADRVLIRPAGCQSLCAILVNDFTKTDGKVCKRGPDGKVPEIGDSCAGGTGCKNAFTLSATFGAYGVTATGF